jgi:predicted PurR-regulated permease PerM
MKVLPPYPELLTLLIVVIFTLVAFVFDGNEVRCRSISFARHRSFSGVTQQAEANLAQTFRESLLAVVQMAKRAMQGLRFELSSTVNSTFSY